MAKLIDNPKTLEVRLEQVLRYIADAKREAEASTAKLFDANGRPRYAEHVEAEMRKGISENYAEAMAELLQEAEGWMMQADSQAKVAHLDPFALLDTGDLQRAGLLAPLVKDAVATLPLSSLAERLTAVAVMGGLPEKLVYAQAAESKRAEMDASARTGNPGDRTGAIEFLAAVDRLREAAKHPKVVAAEELAAALRQAAATVTIATSVADPKRDARRAANTAHTYRQF